MSTQHGAFGEDSFGRMAEGAARFFGTPQYIVGQTIVVIVWMVLNTVALVHHWDPVPFILLNLVFSTQAAYAAPLILLAQTRQADRDKTHGDLIEQRHNTLETATKEQTDRLVRLLESNTDLTRQDKELTQKIHELTTQIHALLQRN